MPRYQNGWGSSVGRATEPATAKHGGVCSRGSRSTAVSGLRESFGAAARRNGGKLRVSVRGVPVLNRRRRAVLKLCGVNDSPGAGSEGHEDHALLLALFAVFSVFRLGFLGSVVLGFGFLRFVLRPGIGAYRTPAEDCKFEGAGRVDVNRVGVEKDRVAGPVLFGGLE